MPKAKSTRFVPRALFWLSLLLFAAGLVIQLTALVNVQPGILIGAGLISLALNILLGGDILIGGGLRTFSARGQVVRSLFDVQTGLCDLSVGKGPNDRVALMRYGPMGQPTFTVTDGVGHLSMHQSLKRPNIAHWQTGLAANILWDIAVCSSSGDINLNLTDLRVEQVSAQTTLGRIQVACPQRGYVTLDLRAQLGQVEVVLPESEGIGVKIEIRRGPLSSLTFKTESGRLLDVGDNIFMTAGYDNAQAHVDISIRSSIGDVIISKPPSP